MSVWLCLWMGLNILGSTGEVNGHTSGSPVQIPRGEMAVLARHSLVRPVGKQRSCWLRLRKPGECGEKCTQGEQVAQSE